MQQSCPTGDARNSVRVSASELRSADTAAHAEFDDFAAEYDGGIGDPFKRLLGGSFEIFFEHKVDWLLRTLSPSGRLLDFGCGEGAFLRALRQSGAPLELVGCDISDGMLATARQRWDADPVPPLYAISPDGLPFADGEFDLVTVICVLHHIKPDKRAPIVRDLVRVVRPGGMLIVFEHNPRNPATRWLIRRALIDANAEPLTAAECSGLLQAGGATPLRTDYLLFFPPRFRRLWAAERFLARVPYGAQYVTLARRWAG